MMNFNERTKILLQTPPLPFTWDSILSECARIENDYAHISSASQAALDHKRFQVEVKRGNRFAALAALKAAIVAAPDNGELLDDYKKYVDRPAIVENIVLIVSSKKNAAKAVRLAWQCDKGKIQYLIVSGSDTAPIEQVRALQVDAPDSYEGTPKKVAAAFSWIYENLGNCGVLKVDDEMILNDPEKLKASLSRMARDNVYAGLPVSNSQFDRCAHRGQCRDDAMNRRVYGRPVLRPWAEGRAYYVAPGPLEKLVFSLTRFPGLLEGEFYEDKLVGDVLLFAGVPLTSVANHAELGLGVVPASSTLTSPALAAGSILGSAAPSRLSKIL